MADVNDWISLTEALAALNKKSDGGASDTRVAFFVTSVSRRLDQAVGAAVQRTITNEEHDGGSTSIVLRHPASAITTVTEYQGTTGVVLTAETPGVIPSNGYKADRHLPDPTLYSGTLWRRQNGYDYWWWGWGGRGNITVTYTAGRYANTSTVDSRFKYAAELFLMNVYGEEEPTTVIQGNYTVPGGRFPTLAVPAVVRDLLHDEWREVGGLA